MCGICLCALCESLLDRIIKLHTNFFNCANLKFRLSTLAKQMTSNTVVVESRCASHPANVLCWLLKSNRRQIALCVTSCKYVLLASQVKSSSNRAVRHILQICFVGFSSQIAMAESVALFTHCRAVQLSVMSS